MKIILENELEKQAWEIILEAQNKWEKNYGETLRQHMEWYLFDLYQDQVKEMIASEARKRVNEKWKHSISLETTLDDYLKDCEIEFDDDEVSRIELVEEYEHLHGNLLWALEEEKIAVKEELMRLYSNFFNSPESLTVIYQKRGLLQKYYEMAQHNLLCYSENCTMNKAKEGFEAEWKQAQAESEWLKEMLVGTL